MGNIVDSIFKSTKFSYTHFLVYLLLIFLVLKRTTVVADDQIYIIIK